MRIKLFEEFSKDWDSDEFLFDLYAMSSTEVENLFFEELMSETPHIEKIKVMLESGLVNTNSKMISTEIENLFFRELKKTQPRVENIKVMLELGLIKADVKSNRMRNALHFVALNNVKQIASMLIDAGVDVNAKDNEDNTPLHLASLVNAIATARLLIEKGANIDAIDKEGKTPLDLAQSDGMRDLLGVKDFSKKIDEDEFLLDLYAMDKEEINTLFLDEVATKDPNIEKIQIMIKSRLVDVREKEKESGATPLHYVSWSNNVDVAELLFKGGAKLEATDNLGETPLHWAAKYNSLYVAKFLIKCGAEKKAKNQKGKIPWQLASSLDMQNLLWFRGAIE